MNAKEQKSKGVVLCRSKNQPNGKEIQGLVFDHPSMPKIITISSGSRKKSSGGSKPSGDSDRHRRELNPNTDGEKYLTGEGNLSAEKYPTGGLHPIGESRPSEKNPRHTHFTRREHANQHTTPLQASTAHYAPEQYSTVHKTPEQHPTRTSPPGLIPVPVEHSKYQHLPARTSNQNERSQVRLPSYHQHGQSAGNQVHVTVTAAANTQFQHSQRATNSQRKREGNSRRHSTGGLRNNFENDVHHRENNGQQTIELGSDAFSRDFHLNVWRQSHQRAARTWSAPECGPGPPVRGLEPPEHRIGQPSHLPPTSGHYVNGSVTHHHSLSAREGESPNMVLPPQRVHKQGGSPLTSSLTPTQREQCGYVMPATRAVRRYSMENVRGVPQVESHNPIDVWTSRGYDSMARNTEGKNSRLSNSGDRASRLSTDGCDSLARFPEKAKPRVRNAGNIRRLSNAMDEFNPVVRNSEVRDLKQLSASNLGTSSADEDYNTAAPNPKGRNLDSLNFDTQKAYGDNWEGCKPVVRNTDGACSRVTSAGGSGRSSSPRKELLDKINAYQRNSTSTTRKKRKNSPAFVVISDSDDEEMKITSPLWNGESNQDVLIMVEPKKQTNKQELVSQSFEFPNDCYSERKRACVIAKVKIPTGTSFPDTVTTASNTAFQSSQHVARSPRTQGATSKRNDAGIRYVVQNERVNSSGRTNHEFRGHDVNNNECRGRVETSYAQSRKGLGGADQESHDERDRSYRSVLCEREVSGQSGTRRVVRSEQVFDKVNRGTKRPLEVDKTQYFVAGPAKVIGSCLDRAARKIVRVSYDEFQNNSFKVERSPDRSGIRPQMFVHSGATSQGLKNYDNLSTFMRWRSEGDALLGQQTVKNTRSSSLTCEPRPFESNTDQGIITPNIIEKMEQFVASKDLSKPAEETRSHYDVSRDETIRVTNVPETPPEAGESSVMSCDEICRPGYENSHTLITLPKTGPKPTGIVVGIKQASEVKVPLLETETVKVAKKTLQCNTEGSEKRAENSGVLYDVMHEKDKMSSGKVSGDLDLLQFTVVKKDHVAASRDHEKSTPSPRGQTHVSQQWEAYSLKLEKEKNTKTVSSCSEDPENGSNITRNSWKELRKMFRTEEEAFLESKRDGVACSDNAERSNATRKQSHSLENTSQPSSRKSYKFHDATKKPSLEYKRQKLSEDDHSETCGRFNSSNSEDETDSSYASTKLSGSEVLVTFTSEKTSNVVNHATQTSTTPTSTNPTKDSTMLLVVTKDSDSRCVISIKSSAKTDTALKRPLLLPRESPKTGESNPSEKKSSEVNTQAIQPSEVKPSEVKPLEVKPSETEPQAAISPQKEEHSIKEWTEILQGRIAQVRESIEEETTPWKTKNKKKVLEKLENHLTWITGTEVDEAFFLARKLQFFQTMKKQYELMRKIKTQRQTMKYSDNATPAVEDAEKHKAKSVKEVGVTHKARDVKSIKCRAKNVKKNVNSNLMKKMRKAVVL